MSFIRFGASGWVDRYDDGFDMAGVVRVARSLGEEWSSGDSGARILVGYDTRYHSRQYAQAAAEVLAGLGLEVIMSTGPCPTPALGWSVSRDNRSVGGLMVTASDFPCDYNGIIVRGEDGGTVSRQFAERVNDRIVASPHAERGHVTYADFCGAYVEALKASIDCELIESRGLTVVVDSMYGSAGATLAGLLRDLGCTVIPLHVCDGDLEVSDIHPQTTEPWVDDCESTVVEQGADLGIVLDGDGGRSALIDECGRLVSSHIAIPLLIEHLVLRRKQEGRVVMTLAASARIDAMAEKLGQECTRVPVGFHRIHDEVLAGGALVGVEEYGGVCIPAHFNERDGLMSALLLIEMLCASGDVVSNLVQNAERSMGSMRYARKDIRMDSGQIQSIRNVLPGYNPEGVVGNKNCWINHADGLRVEFDDGEWLMLRPSRTQPYIRLYAEGKSSGRCDDLMRMAQKILQKQE